MQIKAYCAWGVSHVVPCNTSEIETSFRCMRTIFTQGGVAGRCCSPTAIKVVETSLQPCIGHVTSTVFRGIGRGYPVCSPPRTVFSTTEFRVLIPCQYLTHQGCELCDTVPLRFLTHISRNFAVSTPSLIGKAILEVTRVCPRDISVDTQKHEEREHNGGEVAIDNRGEDRYIPAKSESTLKHGSSFLSHGRTV